MIDLSNDMQCFDGMVQATLIRRTVGVVADVATGEVVALETIVALPYVLVRQLGERGNHAMKQLRMFMQSVQNDDVATIDTIIEVPIMADVEVEYTDIIRVGTTDYTVIAVDTCTLTTRWRVGVRKVK